MYGIKNYEHNVVRREDYADKEWYARHRFDEEEEAEEDKED